jgi:hypothetical protein
MQDSRRITIVGRRHCQRQFAERDACVLDFVAKRCKHSIARRFRPD